ncbi:MAG: hypothetical protein M1829_002556 [Trizodia sp. TS-e1964]|nr:MAG: hypothetical protein M1829_002556 [Trizodia sp. TS-e1964]
MYLQLVFYFTLLSLQLCECSPRRHRKIGITASKVAKKVEDFTGSILYCEQTTDCFNINNPRIAPINVKTFPECAELALKKPGIDSFIFAHILKDVDLIQCYLFPTTVADSRRLSRTDTECQPFVAYNVGAQLCAAGKTNSVIYSTLKPSVVEATVGPAAKIAKEAVGNVIATLPFEGAQKVASQLGVERPSVDTATKDSQGEETSQQGNSAHEAGDSPTSTLSLNQ